MIISTPPLPPQQPTVVVWIHGTNAEKITPAPLRPFIRTVSSVFFNGQPGLHKVSSLDREHYPFLLARALSESDSELFAHNNFYSFGWEGKLSLECRKDASLQLFSSLQTLSSRIFFKTGLLPRIILVAHSHGGNVILHMAEHNKTNDLSIDKVILLACPVQKHTHHLTQHAMFKRIYSLHSHTDLIQIADPQGFHDRSRPSYPILSQRHFKSHPKIAQACICWKEYPQWHPNDAFINEQLLRQLTTPLKLLDKIKKRRGLFHVEFILLPFIRRLPSIIKQLDEHFDTIAHCPTHEDSDILIYL